MKRTREEAFNEWMRRYTEDPHAFEHEWVAVHDFLVKQNAGVPQDYGALCAALLEKLERGE